MFGEPEIKNLLPFVEENARKAIDQVPEDAIPEKWFRWFATLVDRLVSRTKRSKLAISERKRNEAKESLKSVAEDLLKVLITRARLHTKDVDGFVFLADRFPKGSEEQKKLRSALAGRIVNESKTLRCAPEDAEEAEETPELLERVGQEVANLPEPHAKHVGHKNDVEQIRNEFQEYVRDRNRLAESVAQEGRVTKKLAEEARALCEKLRKVHERVRTVRRAIETDERDRLKQRLHIAERTHSKRRIPAKRPLPDVRWVPKFGPPAETSPPTTPVVARQGWGSRQNWPRPRFQEDLKAEAGLLLGEMERTEAKRDFPEEYVNVRAIRDASVVESATLTEEEVRQMHDTLNEIRQLIVNAGWMRVLDEAADARRLVYAAVRAIEDLVNDNPNSKKKKEEEARLPELKISLLALNGLPSEVLSIEDVEFWRKVVGEAVSRAEEVKRVYCENPTFFGRRYCFDKDLGQA